MTIPEGDRSQLTVSAVLHYVWAGTNFLLGGIPLIYVVMGIMMATQAGIFAPNGSSEFRVQPTPDDVLFGREPGDPDFDPMPGEPDEFSRNDGQEELELVGSIMAGVSGAIVALVWLYALVVAFAGWSIQKRKRHTFCIIVAGFSCLSVPFGTGLGIFTIILLQRPAVRAAFGKT